MRRWRKLLLPLSWIYGVVIFIRNYLFDIQFFKSVSYDFPVICIGNLSVGGTGKTPMTEYIAQLLSSHHNTAILSRGYKRVTSGFILSDENASAESIGDEPFQYHKKLKEVHVAVDEDRRHGISSLKQMVHPEVVILDDAFQHRKVKAGLNILLTMYNDLYVNDLLLPAGNLRDLKSQAKRAEIIVVTKCPPKLSVQERDEIIERLNPCSHQKVFFATIVYKEHAYANSEKFSLQNLQGRSITVVTGIAHPEPFLNYLESIGLQFDHKQYADHHNFSPSEIEELKQKELILTTEKDYVRLENKLNNVFYLPIEVSFISEEDTFKTEVLNFAACS
ncbi:tetraacyldisaccharide 4'-kinase [Galbibacter sp. BG1]|uniref:tetraacyldisaccharide 4'-kinase n=1 Tax=Galbibacter sp. BG1 TaxID=1170699 RepID=UPI0015BC028D|nr:tetraacyldisaccharide 4'-kinase [Galbibacter sp. BG1]QLE01707.1 tetraacyldisaccharide 4'-kinase [Galbibacter sp. BG1]